MSKLGPIGVRMLEERKINRAIAERLQIFTGRAQRGGAVVPDESGNVLCFPFFEDGRVVAVKFRGPDKKFWQQPGGQRTFYNSEALDMAMRMGDEQRDRERPPSPLVITEGEIDCLSAVEAGWDCAVSVPDGAPAPRSETGDDIREEQSGKFAFLFNNRDRLKHVERFVIAVDNDTNGKYLAGELIRRLGAGRCSLAEYPIGCKDLNDVLVQHGPGEVMRVLKAAQPVPVHGIYRLSDYPDIQETQVFGTGWETLDRHLKLFPGELMVVTGIPGHGKSSWVTNLAANCAVNHDWRTAFFSPEMPVVPHLRNKLRALYWSRHSDSQRSPPFNETEKNEADDWIEDYFIFLDSDPKRSWENDQDKTLEWIQDKAAEVVMTDGIRFLVIDPWNEVEHSRRKGEMLSEYIGRGIRDLRRFATERGVAVIIVAHPTKDIASGDIIRAPTLYDIDGSAHWANKPDHGVTIFRPEDASMQTQIHVTKVRFAETGTPGSVRMRYNRERERYQMLSSEEITLAERIEAEREYQRRQAKKRKPRKPDLRIVPPAED